MVDTKRGQPLRRLRTPRAAAYAGIIFAVLFATSVALLRSVVPDDPFAQIGWVTDGKTRISTALVLAPLAMIAFLWFIGVIRDQLGAFEDRFFATVFLGSGLVFIAMVAIAMSFAGAILIVVRAPGTPPEELIYLARSMMLQVSNVWGARFAAVFMISLATIWLRTGLMPRWLPFTSYLLALALLLVVSRSLWVTLVFPIWVCAISVVILIRNSAGGARPPATR